MLNTTAWLLATFVQILLTKITNSQFSNHNFESKLQELLKI